MIVEGRMVVLVVVGGGAECASIFLVGLIVKNGSLLLVFWAGQQSGHNGYLLWDLIGQLA